MAKAFLAAVVLIAAACGSAKKPAPRAHSASPAHTASNPTATRPKTTSRTVRRAPSSRDTATTRNPLTNH